MIRSLSCSPPIFSLIETSPVVLPEMCPPESSAVSIMPSAVRVAMAKPCASLALEAPSATLYSAASAWAT